MTAAPPKIAQHLFLPEEIGGTGFHLFFRRLPTPEERAGLLAKATAEPTPALRRKALVVGTLCTHDGTPQTLPPGELAKLDAMGLDDWDECLLKAAHLNGFAPLRVTLG